MSIEYIHKFKKEIDIRTRRSRLSTPKAGPVKVTKADGTVEIRPPYSRADRDRIVAAGLRRRRST